MLEVRGQRIGSKGFKGGRISKCIFIIIICLFYSAIVIMEYGASLTYEDQMIDLEDPNFLVPQAAGGKNRSTTPLSQESTDSCHNNEAFEKGKIYF